MEIRAELEKSPSRQQSQVGSSQLRSPAGAGLATGPSRNSDLGFSRCETCNSDLGGVKMYAPLYCVPCIEEMEKLNMSPKKYKRYREISETLGKR